MARERRPSSPLTGSARGVVLTMALGLTVIAVGWLIAAVLTLVMT
jgi:hypothetical protein